MLRRIFLLFLSLAMVLSLLPTVAFAANSAELKFEVENGEATLVHGSTASGALTIPGRYKGYPVTAIGDSALLECADLTSVVIPDSVTSVGTSAFSGCKKLASVTLGSGVTYIDSRAFYKCTALKTLIFAEDSKLETIWQNAFQGCTALSSITLPDSVRYIANYAFQGCSSLKSVALPASLEWIGAYAFQKCKALTQLTLPEALSHIESGAFEDCSALKELHLSRVLTYIAPDAFTGTAVSLKDVLPSSMHKEPDGSYVGGEDVILAGVLNYDYAAEVLELLNEERAAEGLAPLRYNETLASHAQQRAAEIRVLFGHDRPNGRSFAACLRPFATTFGENIAYGYPNPEAVMEAWMNSPGHRSNILKSTWNSVGIGCYCYDGAYYWVQVFSNIEASGTAPSGTEPVNSCVTVCTDAFSVYTQQLVYAYMSRDLITPFYYTEPQRITGNAGELLHPEAGFWHADDLLNIPGDMVQWKADDPTVARCTEDGIVCLRSGTTTLTATFGSLVQTFTLEVSGALPVDCDGGLMCPGFQFVDMPSASDWSHAGIDFALSNGLFQGVSDHEFEPEEPMTRAMLVTVLWRLEGKPAPAGENVFLDVRNNFWYTEPIIWAFENGIVNGVGEGCFEPDERITREQMATILYRYAQGKGYDVSAFTSLEQYQDWRAVNIWALDAFSWANAEGLIQGTTFTGLPGTWLDPEGSATRAQVATILMRFVQNIT